MSKVDGICVCWKTLKDDYTLNLKVKLLFFGLNHEGEFILKSLQKICEHCGLYHMNSANFLRKHTFFPAKTWSQAGFTVRQIDRECYTNQRDE